MTWKGKFIQPVRVSTSPNPTIPMVGLLRRLDELRQSPRQLGQDTVQDEQDLIDLVGEMGYVIQLHDQGRSNATCLQASIWEAIIWPSPGLVD
jgi:hypothetical protein